MPDLEVPREELRADFERVVQLVRDLDEDDATVVFDRIAKQVEADTELAIATQLALAAAFRKAYASEWAARSLEKALTMVDGERWIDIAVDLVAEYGEACSHEQVDRVIGEILARADDVAVRLRIVAALERATETQRALAQIRAALACPMPASQRLELLLKLHAKLSEPEEIAAVREEILPLLAEPEGLSLDTQIRAHVELQHILRAVELAAGSADAELRASVNERYAETLFDAGELALAEAIVVALPPDIDEYGQPEKGDGAFLDHIRRKRGTQAYPPEIVFAELPPRPRDPDSTFDFFSDATDVPEGFALVFTKLADTAAMIRGGHLVQPYKVLEWSHGAITSTDDLSSQKIFGPIKSYACRCERFLGNQYRGVVCHKCGVEVVSSSMRAYRPAHLRLPERVVHPWFIHAIARLLDISQPAVRARDGASLHDELQDVSVAYRAEWLREELRSTRSSTKRASLAERLVIFEAFADSFAKPEWCVLEELPVWPPAAVLPDGVTREAVTRAYADILHPPNLTQAVRRLFNLFAT